MGTRHAASRLSVHYIVVTMQGWIEYINLAFHLTFIMQANHAIARLQPGKTSPVIQGCYVKDRRYKVSKYLCVVSVSLFLSMLVVAFLCCVLLCFCKGVSPCRRRGFASWPRSYLVNLRASALRCIYNPLF